MILTPKMLRACRGCSKPIEIGQRMVIHTTGSVETVGGLGMYKDAPTLRGVDEGYFHEDCYAQNRLHHQTP